MQTTTQTIETGWRVREVGATHVPGHNQLPWLPAQVPGHVHLDLLRSGVIPDPFRRIHERDVQWVDESDWVYETEFTVSDPPPANAYLKFHGLDTLAEIVLNGEELGRTENMLIPHEFPVGGKLKAGENTLTITFRSALRVGRERQAAWNEGGNPTVPYHWDNWAERAFVRKAQYTSGWDWGPVLRSCGIWQKVELITVPVARIGDWKYDYEFTGEDTVRVTVTAEIERTDADTPLAVKVYLRQTEAEAQVDVPTGIGTHSVRVALPEVTIKRWQPSGISQSKNPLSSLYTLDLAVGTSETITTQYLDYASDWKMVGIGFRTVELMQEPDADGKGTGFKFRVNGIDIFAKGANWIPNDSFPARITYPPVSRKNSALFQRIWQAKEAGFNMLRVWGGGLYESEEFYKICDELGILVWQDFAYGCSYYPDTGEYAEQAKIEATAAVRRIRNHPSLALWCGNNENQMMYQGNWTGTRPPRLLGEHLYDTILPDVVAAEDPKTPYWPGSPFGGDNVNSPDIGDCHNWDVWHGRGDWVHYTENDARFCSEFGFGSSCSLAAWDSCLDVADKHPWSPAVRWHDKTRKGYETFQNLVAIHYPRAQTLEDWVYFSQLNQAEAMKYGVEHYRRRKGRCWGTLIWQLNDCWPVQSWALIDSVGEPKASYFASKKFYAPVLLSLVHSEETVEAHLVNDLLTPLQGHITLTIATYDGEALSVQTKAVSVDANAATGAATFDLTEAIGFEREAYIYAQFLAEDETLIADNYLLLAEPKDLALPTPGLSVTVAQGKSRFEITLTAQRFAPYVWLRLSDNAPLNLNDNFFHLRPGETRTLTVTKSESVRTAEELRGKLVVRTL